ncbi:hypothetical protein N7532_001513 [Penicillium argentinense]|uniref:Uncharacterized protein n=1 Tax=Penicillium argentinense TaxID=1131581 RepID=A0A9W9G2R1_9EURO|nr:uncharacterized protein N7532_001513 [Penicillium argentinense]KAJ5110978.1 hypothetical protein N7532_001513 [Penicillium argentinense]
MEQSLAHHRDINMPQRLDAVTITEFTESEEVQSLIQRIRHLTSEISGKPHLHEHLAKERSQLYTRKAKLLAARKSEFIQEWWNSSYEEYVSGNEFTERDRTSLFEIYKKYLPERTRRQQWIERLTEHALKIWLSFVSLLSGLHIIQGFFRKRNNVQPALVLC